MRVQMRVQARGRGRVQVQVGVLVQLWPQVQAQVLCEGWFWLCVQVCDMGRQGCIDIEYSSNHIHEVVKLTEIRCPTATS